LVLYLITQILIFALKFNTTCSMKSGDIRLLKAIYGSVILSNLKLLSRVCSAKYEEMFKHAACYSFLSSLPPIRPPATAPAAPPMAAATAALPPAIAVMAAAPAAPIPAPVRAPFSEPDIFAQETAIKSISINVIVISFFIFYLQSGILNFRSIIFAIEQRYQRRGFPAMPVLILGFIIVSHMTRITERFI
jgi:hypothetical protein